ncbi:MAG: HD domain-containing protein [Treponema sp.]|jgi:poly(A) polymerase|nr:HD domain-containing protein [Treponema sp.]
MICEAALPDILVSSGFSLRLRGFSAIDRYLGREDLPFIFADTGAGLSDLARHIEGLRFPGPSLADAAAESGERTWYFRCLDADEPSPDSRFSAGQDGGSFECLDFYQDRETGRFQDPWGLYPWLRGLSGKGRGRGAGMAGSHVRDHGGKTAGRAGVPEPFPWWEGLRAGADRYRALLEGALILSRYCGGGYRPRLIEEIAGLFDRLPGGQPPGEEEQRLFLAGMLCSPNPGLGLEFLKTAGFVGEFWPELAVLDDVDHSKEFHPEGNVWKHTLETFRYRKTAGGGRVSHDLVLSLGLLLHDTGKALAGTEGGRRFSGHAELGARTARRFLERLGFDPALADAVCYLVKNHMLPAALPRLPLKRVEEVIASPFFPTLLELYRCDESSSFKGLDGYYESSATYQSYLKYRRNPYRLTDGKKMGKRELSER